MMDGVLGAIVNRWTTAIDAAYEARKGWDDTVFLCREFYRGALDFMWSEKFQGKYFGGKLTPRFKINLNKMFDMVALYAPSLVWDQVTRMAKVEKGFEWDADVFGDPNDPQAQQLHQQSLMQAFPRETFTKYQTRAFDKWLNYTPREMPDGTMTLHSERCVVDGLISGRGVLLPRDYKMPGSGRKLTGCFWTSSENVLYDPDATNRNDAQYMIIRCVEPRWKVERDRGYEEGALKRAGGYESYNHQLDRRGYGNYEENRGGKSYDTLVYYKVYSRMGVGGRLKDAREAFGRVRGYLDRIVGDYAYLEICPGLKHPLNCNPAKLRDATDEQVRDWFRWPIPWWLDNRWPAALLDFYHRDDSSYPIPPMAAALGPLIYMNIAMSNLANRVWSSSRDFIGIVESAWETVAPYFQKGDDLALIKVPQIFAKDMEEIVKFIKQPPVTADQYQMLDRMSDEFMKSSGLVPYLYGGGAGTQTRSAKAEENREVAAGIRPQYMAKKVDEHQAECAEMEKQAAYWTLDAKDVDPQIPHWIWQRFVVDEPEPERIIRSIRVTVDAQSGRRPNKLRDAENMAKMLPAVLPELSKHADVTGDTEPLKAMIRKWGESIEQDMSEIDGMGPRVPMPPPPEIQEQQQQMQQAELASIQAKTQADVVKSQAAVTKASVDMQKTMLDAQLKQQEIQQRGVEAQLDAEEDWQELLFGREQSRLALATQSEQGALKIAEAESLAATKIASAEEMARIQADAAKAKAKAAAAKPIKKQPKAKAGT